MTDPIHGPLIEPSPYPRAWLESALQITGAFEGCGFGTATGDFDGMGVSAGVLQWNYGQGSLQSKILAPAIQVMGAKRVDTFFPVPVSVTASMSAKDAVAYARKHMLNGKVLKPTWRDAWIKLMLMAEVKEIQMDAASSIASRAFQDAIHSGLRSKRAFCWFFDVYVQNGSLKGIQKPQMPITEKITRWFQSITGEQGIQADVPMPFPVFAEYEKNVLAEGGVNKELWLKETKDEEAIILFNWIILRANNNQWRQDVISRKGTIAHMIGNVHGKRYELRDILAQERV